MVNVADSYRELWEDFGREKNAAYFGYKFNPIHRVGLTNFLREEEIFRMAQVRPEDSVLDVGCASGQHIFELAKVAREACGVDIAQSFIDAALEHRAKTGALNTQFMRAPVEQLPFEDSRFDLIICAEVLEHVFDKERALTELLRVLRPGGRLIISVPNLNADATYYGRLLRALRIRSFTPIETFSSEELVAHGDAHVREYDFTGLSQWLSGNGLRVEDIRSVSFIDGPRWFEYILKIPLRIGFLRKTLIGLERICTRMHFTWGRHLVVKSIKQ